jgi:hypothetical protein
MVNPFRGRKEEEEEEEEAEEEEECNSCPLSLWERG